MEIMAAVIMERYLLRVISNSDSGKVSNISMVLFLNSSEKLFIERAGIKKIIIIGAASKSELKLACLIKNRGIT
jgi:hypothetical protein